ncbi:type II toxin-antitoxin system prevent-host-death family antitoxin [Mammaliicoccus sp. E-M24]|uniref:type II toxin-antitoxin system Phd/YefM family antitoxin n=1 Tax=Mammaliicoccus sp. E-M24 TaxID=2898684 RepID=UPI001EFA8913|nr:type II toxin-antitoxin system prevent-host-death family antitoxin [Mammaliicoccus sp. E-M24]
MTVTTYSNARRNFKTLIEQVNDNSEAVIVTTKNEKNAVILSEEDYNSIMETLYLQQSPANAKRLNNSISNLERNNTVEVDIEEYE